MSDDDLTPAERAEIERVHGVLADAAVCAEPPFELQERVVAAIAEEAGAGRRMRRIRYSLVAAAAAVVVAVGLVGGGRRRGGGVCPRPRPRRFLGDPVVGGLGKAARLGTLLLEARRELDHAARARHLVVRTSTLEQVPAQPSPAQSSPSVD